MLNKIKKLIPERYKVKINLFFTPVNQHYLSLADTNEQIIYVFLAGFYQNLGDMALTYSQKIFLQTCYPMAKVITIASTETYTAVRSIRKKIKPTDIITIIGGGNMDDMYTSLEEARLHVVKSFPNNRIISFPQTVAFSDTPYGRKRSEISRKVYEKHKNLVIFVREPYSFEKIKIIFPRVSVGYCPDIVLSLDKTEPRKERKGVLCCLRSDKEQSIGDLKERLCVAISKQYMNVQFIDTVDVTLDECKPEAYEVTLERFWTMLRGTRVVLTDRLHCMIFCVITGTPCVVMDNSNHKISGVYKQWLKDISYVSLIETLEVEKILDEMKRLEEIDSRNLHYGLSKMFSPLRAACIDE